MTPHTEAELRGDLELLNRTVAEACGWKPFSSSLTKGFPAWTPPEGGVFQFADGLPDFTVSLDACRTFEDGMTEEEWDRFTGFLYEIALKGDKPSIRVRLVVVTRVLKLKATDHCIAFLKLKGVCG